MALDLEQRKRPSGVVFDMDGTLLDTEGPARTAFAKAIVEVGFEFNAVVYDRCLGSTFAETKEILVAAHGKGLDTEELQRAWTANFFFIRDSAPIELRPGIAELLQRLQQLDIAMAVATSNQREICESLLSDCGIRQYFTHLVCVEDVRNPKPAPDPYLLAAAKLGKQSADCWALEDSDIGTRAAVESGMRTFQIPDAGAPNESVLALGHEVLASASELLALLSEPES